MQLCKIEIHGHELAYRSAGSGPVVLLIHGNSDGVGGWETLTPRSHMIAPA